jgi:predicted nucleic acid-binding protein
VISTFTAIFDANVFFGARLRSLIMELAQTGLFRARWTNAIHDEWMRNLAKKRGIDVERLHRTRDAMNAAVLDCLVTGYEPLIGVLSLPDTDDRHVLAAAIRGNASAIVTFNEKDFPKDVLEKYGIHCVHPDDFLLDLHSLYISHFAAAIVRDLSHYKNPPISLDSYIGDLEAAGVPKTAAQIKELAVLIESVVVRGASD